MTRDLTTRSRSRFLLHALRTWLIVAAPAATILIGAPLARAFALSASTGAAQDSPAPDAEAETEDATAEDRAPHCDPFELRPQLEQASVALELSAFLTSRGDAESARDLLRGVDEASMDDALRQRVVDELSRVEAWIETRDRFLRQLQETGRKYQVLDGEKRRRVLIERIEDGTLYFAENR